MEPIRGESSLCDDIIHIILGLLSECFVVGSNKHADIHVSHPFETTWYTSAYSKAEHEFKRSLVACSLVNRRWAVLSRAYLFRTLGIRFSTYAEPRSLEDVLAWMKSYGELAAHVRTLRLIMVHSKCRHTSYEVKPGDYCNLATLAGIVTRCPSLQSLQLIDVRIRYYVQIPDILPRAPMLDKPIDLQRCLWVQRAHCPQSVKDFCSVLSWFGNVGTLLLDLGMSNHLLQDKSHPITPPWLAVQSLELAGLHPSPNLINGIMSTPTGQPGYLKAISLNFDSYFSRTPASLFGAVASHVKELQVYVHNDDKMDHCSGFNCIEKLTLILPVQDLTHEDFYSKANLSSLLAQLSDTTSPTRPPIQHIVLDLRPMSHIDGTPTYDHRTSLMDVDNIVASIPGLKRFELLLPTCSSDIGSGMNACLHSYCRAV